MLGGRCGTAVAMKVTRVEPRDQTWEMDELTHRIYFHTESRSCDDHDLTGSTRPSVMDWTEADRHGRTYLLHAVVPGDGLGLLRPKGFDPNEAEVPNINLMED